MESRRPWQTVVELPAYQSQAAKLLTAEEQVSVILLLAQDPEAGVVIKGTGGVRKVRIGASGRGKSGGARVIYFLHNAELPIFLLALFAKNERSDLSRAEQAALRKVCEGIVADHTRRKR